MEILRLVLVLLHFVGFAALFGGAFVQLKGPKRAVTPAMWHGVLTMLVTGLLIVGVSEMGGADLNHMKIGIKLVVALAVFVLVLLQRKKAEVAPGMFFTIAGLTLLNAAVAVFV
jgi:hypothetical protein